jgi:hypothetical protein
MLDVLDGCDGTGGRDVLEYARIHTESRKEAMQS